MAVAVDVIISKLQLIVECSNKMAATLCCIFHRIFFVENAALLLKDNLYFTKDYISS